MDKILKSDTGKYIFSKEFVSFLEDLLNLAFLCIDNWYLS